jgi:hypothetical protein
MVMSHRWQPGPMLQRCQPMYSPTIRIESPLLQARCIRVLRQGRGSRNWARAVPYEVCNDCLVVERLEVQRAIAAEPGAIFGVLTSPSGHVAIDSSGMLTDATGEAVTSVGDSFVVHMDREALNDYPLGLYDVTVRIVTLESDREIAWKIEGQLNLGHVYGYKLEPIAEGTLVISYYDWSSVDQEWKDAAIFPVISEGALRATLGILARTVAPGRARPSA